MTDHTAVCDLNVFEFFLVSPNIFDTRGNRLKTDTKHSNDAQKPFVVADRSQCLFYTFDL